MPDPTTTPEPQPEKSAADKIKEKLANLDKLKKEARRMAGGAGQANRDASAERSREKSSVVRDIGELPAVRDPARRTLCKTSLERFCTSYFPYTFTLAFSPDHRKVLAKIELAVLKGGLFALAMPRGSGKTTLCEIAALWAIIYGHHQFVLLIGSDVDAAQQMLSSIKTELEGNDFLLGDFPEVCFPIQRLEGEPRRCKGQTHLGERTLSQWSDKVIVLPTIAGSAASGAIVKAAGITGKIRGLKFKRADGSSVRPSLVIPDDPQTDESANSLGQCETRERTLAGAVLGLAGPGKKISGIMPCTVIRAGDLADRMLDTKQHPEWNGSRFKLIYSFPTEVRLWDRYKEILTDYNGERPGDRERAASDATLFYLENSDAMDAGAVVAWAERFSPDELTAVQHAMNLRYRDERAFWAEFQNTPLPEKLGDVVELSADFVAGKINRTPRWKVPVTATRLTAFIDVQKDLLYYCVCAWEDDFTGYVVDYGAWPDQKKAYWLLRDARPAICQATTAQGFEGQIYEALAALTGKLLGGEWQRDTSTLKIERCLIDANWGQSTDIVYQFCRQSPYAAVLTPSHGKYVGASSLPLTDRKRKPGERLGLNWVMPIPASKRAIRHVIFDSNFWKSFLSARLAMAMGARGCLSLFGDSPDLHRMAADHLISEYRVKVEGRGRVVDEWKLKPGAENHLLDCAVGCCIAASMQGVSLTAVHAGTRQSSRPVVSFAKQREQAKRKRR